MDNHDNHKTKMIPDDLPSNSLLSYNPNKTLVDTMPSKKKEQSDKRLSSTSRPTLKDVPPLKTEGDTYRLRKKIGQGGMGEVLEALQVNLSRVVAIKRLRQDVKNEVRKTAPEESEHLDVSFRQEVIATANLDHPNVLPVYDLGQDQDGEPIMAMKFVRGTPWDEVIKEDFEKLDVEDFLSKHINILIDVSQAVAFAHSRGIVHRDLKPAQVMLGEYGEVLLADWGLAVIYDMDALNQYEQDIPVNLMPTPDKAGNPAGTPAFMAPEQTKDTAENIGPWTDIYLLGGILFQILTGSPPITGENAHKCFFKAMSGEITNPEILSPERKKPPELLRIAMKALSQDKSERYSSAREFLETLKECVSGARKRHEADKLLKGAEAILAEAKDDYCSITKALTDIAQANGLWGEHPDLYSMTCKAHHQMAHTALEKGDLSLAQVHAQNMPQGPEQESMVELVERKTIAFQQREKQRHMALKGVRVLLAIIILGGIIFTSWLYTERSRTREALDEALIQRQNALKSSSETRSFVNFLLEDLGEQLAPLDQIEVFTQIGSRVVTFYDSLPPDQRTDQTEYERAEALWAYGHPLLIMGDFNKGVYHATEAFNILTNLNENNPSEKYFKKMVMYGGMVSASYAVRHEEIKQERLWTKLSLEALQFLALSSPESIHPDDIKTLETIINDQGGHAKTDEQRKAMLHTIEDLTEWNTDDAQWQMRNAIMGSWLAELFEQQGHYQMALQGYEEAVNLHWDLHSQGQLQQKHLLKIIENNLESCRIFERLNDTKNAQVKLDIATEVVESQLRDNPMDHAALRCKAQVLRFKSRLLDKNGESGKAIDTIQDSVKLAETISANDPSNAVYQYDLGISMQQLASLQIKDGNLDQGRSILLEIITMMKPFCEDPNENTFWVRLMNLTVARANELTDLYEEQGKTKQVSNIQQQIAFWKNTNTITPKLILDAEFIAGTIR